MQPGKTEPIRAGNDMEQSVSQPWPTVFGSSSQLEKLEDDESKVVLASPDARLRAKPNAC